MPWKGPTEGDEDVPKTNGQGRSDYTPIKQDRLAQILAWHIPLTAHAIQKAAWAERHSYYMIDLTSGCGHNPDNPSEKGSPLIALDALKAWPHEVQAVFCDRDEKSHDKLRRTLEHLRGQGDIPTHWKMAVGALTCTRALRETIAIMGRRRQSRTRPEAQMGLAYLDPNGIGSTADLAALSDMIRMFNRSRELQYIDVLLHLPATSYKRVSRSMEARGSMPLPPLMDLVSKFKKTYKYVSKLSSQTQGRRWQWAFYFLTNAGPGRVRPPRALFDLFTSPDGIDRANIINLTDEQRKRLQPTSLFPEIGTEKCYG
jgi:three-Cys-motif partner protein